MEQESVLKLVSYVSFRSSEGLLIKNSAVLAPLGSVSAEHSEIGSNMGHTRSRRPGGISAGALFKRSREGLFTT